MWWTADCLYLDGGARDSVEPDEHATGGSGTGGSEVSRRVSGRVIRGHRVASGLATDSPYSAGTIETQAPVFASLGLDISGYFPATINVDISPLHFRIVTPTVRLDQVRWCDQHPPETFSFCSCRVVFSETEYRGLIYYPHPETKKLHFQDDQTVEILAPRVPGLRYGSIIVLVTGHEVRFT